MFICQTFHFTCYLLQMKCIFALLLVSFVNIRTVFCIFVIFVLLCSKLLEVFKTKARYNWGMRSSNAFEKALKHYDFH